MTMRKIACGAIAALTLATTMTLPTHAAKKKPAADPIAIISTAEFDANWEKLDANIMWCERAEGIVTNKKGDGKNIKNNGYINYSKDRYHGKKLPKGAKVTSYFWYGPNHEDVEMRVDYYKGELVHFS